MASRNELHREGRSGDNVFDRNPDGLVRLGAKSGGERWRAMRLERLSSALWLEFKLCSELYETDTRVASYIFCDLAGTFGFDVVA